MRRRDAIQHHQHNLNNNLKEKKTIQIREVKDSKVVKEAAEDELSPVILFITKKIILVFAALFQLACIALLKH